jgi:hypothetical protein
VQTHASTTWRNEAGKVEVKHTMRDTAWLRKLYDDRVQMGEFPVGGWEELLCRVPVRQTFEWSVKPHVVNPPDGPPRDRLTGSAGTWEEAETQARAAAAGYGIPMADESRFLCGCWTVLQGWSLTAIGVSENCEGLNDGSGVRWAYWDVTRNIGSSKYDTQSVRGRVMGGVYADGIKVAEDAMRALIASFPAPAV